MMRCGEARGGGCKQTYSSMTLPPLFTACTALRTIDAERYFALVRDGKAFPIPTSMLPRFQYLMLIVQSAEETDAEVVAAHVHGGGGPSTSTSSGGTAAVRTFDIDADMFTDDAMAIVASYCRLSARTAASDVPRDVERFLSVITSAERSFLDAALPLQAPNQSIEYAFQALKLAEFLQFEDLLVLLSGAVAHRLHGRTTEGMRSLLGIDPSTPEEALFSPDTMYLLRAEDEWSRVPTRLP